jgi:acetyl esterase/lipase
MRWVVTPAANPARRIVYFHGGGYLAGGFHSHRPLVAWLSHEARAAVLFVDYRLAPEHRFPAALDDACTALAFAAITGPTGYDNAVPAQLIVGGDSAGGGIAIASQLRMRDMGQPMTRGIFSLCGMLDLDERTSTFLSKSQRTRDSARLVVSWLDELRHPYLSVVNANTWGLPPVFLQTGTDDYCREDSIRFAALAGGAGVSTTLDDWPDMFHVWQRFVPKVPEAAAAVERVGAFCRQHLE